MPEVVAVKLRFNPKPLWFSSEGISTETGDHVIVETERGTEMGLATGAPFDVTDGQVSMLVSPLHPLLRIATDDDFDHADELARKGDDAMPVFREVVEKHGLAMKPVAVEYLFGGEKAVFYFAAEERVDFRDCVRELASRFHTRIDMRQIGVRDEARLVGGIGHCGQELCCARFGGDFQPVSIRMAKEQDLPLNPVNISGLCGRLMCCLRYEFDAYKDFKSRAPKKGALIETPLGTAKVVDFNTPAEQIMMRLEDGKSFTVPLAGMECKKAEDGTCTRPCSVPLETLQKSNDSAIALALSSLEHDLDLDDAPSHASSQRTPTRRRRSTGTTSAAPASQEASPAEETLDNQQASNGSNGTSRRRRRGRGQHSAQEDEQAAERQTRQPSDGASRQRSQQVQRPRPGQHSSGARASGNAGANANAGSNSGAANRDRQAAQHQHQERRTQPAGGGESMPQRKPRRRHEGHGNAESSGESK